MFNNEQWTHYVFIINITQRLENKSTINNTSLNCAGPLIRRFFSINVQLSLQIPRFYMDRFNQTLIKNSIFDPQLEICNVESQLYALFYATLCKGLEHPQILVSRRHTVQRWGISFTAGFADLGFCPILAQLCVSPSQHCDYENVFWLSTFLPLNTKHFPI